MLLSFPPPFSICSFSKLHLQFFFCYYLSMGIELRGNRNKKYYTHTSHRVFFRPLSYSVYCTM